MEILTLVLFCEALIACLIFDKSIIIALIIGLVLFVVYALRQNFKFTEITDMCLEGVKRVKGILFTFVLIGILTAFWRASGTISTIICYSTGVFTPPLFLLMTFLLNTLVSFLTGTSFVSSATIGVISMTMAVTMGINPLWVAGAVMSGSYWGDRCSPVSTSALLVAQVTDTNIYDNIPQMLKTGMVPTIAATLIYLVKGLLTPAGNSNLDIRSLFDGTFNIHLIALLPAIVILVFSLARVNVEITMAASIIAALPICLFLQHVSIGTLIHTALYGYQIGYSVLPEAGFLNAFLPGTESIVYASEQATKLAGMLDGGGITSMIRVGIIVAISSSYSGIFRRTKLLSPLRNVIEGIARKTNPFTAILCTATLSCSIACSQTLGTMLTQQLCEDLTSKEKLAIHLEDTAIIISALIPWCIAAQVPLATIGAPMTALLFSFYVYLVPLWQLIVSFVKKD